MTVLQAVLLGVVQGLTEFLPVSSTAHLLIIPHYLGWPDPGAAFSAAIQLGTLAAVFVYFAGDIKRLSGAAIEGLRHRNLRHTPDSLIAWSIIPATIPIGVLGLGLSDFIETEFRSLAVVASALIALALFLLVAERRGKRTREMGQLRFWQVQVIGFCQALALIPGCSRSGSTIMGGLFCGLRRSEAARFSFVLGLPAIGASGLLKLIELIETQPPGEGLLSLAAGIVAAAISGYLSIGFLLRFLERHGTYWFAYYRICLGLFILSGLYL
jgi:undecaprenyl-diphosphatase